MFNLIETRYSMHPLSLIVETMLLLWSVTETCYSKQQLLLIDILQMLNTWIKVWKTSYQNLSCHSIASDVCSEVYISQRTCLISSVNIGATGWLTKNILTAYIACCCFIGLYIYICVVWHHQELLHWWHVASNNIVKIRLLDLWTASINSNTYKQLLNVYIIHRHCPCYVYHTYLIFTAVMSNIFT